MADTILPHQLPDALDGEDGLSVLSLDCFDTLLWRDVHAPTDIFGLLGDVAPAHRRYAESSARKARHLAMRGGSAEVTLHEIYAAYARSADKTARDVLVEAEIAAEVRHCYAFGPTVALMREAKRRGLKVVIVSDTYLKCDQLEHLIRMAAGDAVADLIDTIFCSCEHRSSKGEALFDTVLKTLRTPADAILHIGDNPRADLASAKRHGLRARHLVQFGEPTVQRLRQEATADALLLGEGVRFQPHRAALAVSEPLIGDPAEAFGHSVLGPVFTTFADWLGAEADALAEERGGTVHQLFLMRDGHLPALVAEACDTTRAAHRVEISRFTAIAASLQSEAGVRRYLHEEIGDDAGKELLNQLLLLPIERDQLLARKPKVRGAYWLFDQLLSPRWLKIIVARGRAYADRLAAYLTAIVNPAPGDTLMLVDLGYNGSVQNRVDALLAERFGVHVAGRYLLLQEDTPSAFDKRGMIDRRTHDEGAIATMLSSVAVLEQLCTVPQGSVIDYRNGEAIRAAPGVKGAQSEIRRRVQAGVVRFARDHAHAIVRREDAGRTESWARAATPALGRLLLLPLPHELALLTEFEHDVNLGTAQTVPLFDKSAAAQGMRQGGLFYMKGTDRMFLPAELRGQGLPTSLTHIVGKRFGLDLRYADFCDQDITLPVLIADGSNVFTETVRATPTHEGYYVAAVPVGLGKLTVGLQFGQVFEWLQIDSVSFHPVAAFMSGAHITERTSFPALPSCEGLEQVAPHVFRSDANGFLMVPPPPGDHPLPLMLNVVFRPLVPREAPVPAPAETDVANAGAVL